MIFVRFVKISPQEENNGQVEVVGKVAEVTHGGLIRLQFAHISFNTALHSCSKDLMFLIPKSISPFYFDTFNLDIPPF